MEQRVVAIVVAREGGDPLSRTLRALDAQTRRPDSVVVVDNSGKGLIAPTLTGFSGGLVELPHRLDRGAAIAAAVADLAEASSESFLWLLDQHSDPDSSALERLIGALEVSPSVAVVGPKQMSTERRDFIREFGLTVTRWGRTTSLVTDELDQAQHDNLSDVMAVGANGMLVRHEVWRSLGGFDPGLGVADDALDFCMRARLAGNRVAVVPTARVRAADDVPADGNERQAARVAARRARQARAAQLYRRLTYARGFGLIWHWLGLLPNAAVRIAGLLLGKRPTMVIGEIVASFQVMFDGFSVGRSRRNLRRVRTMPFGSLDPLKMSFAEVRRRNALEREALRIRAHGHHRPVYFFASGGAWVTLSLLLVSTLLMAPLIGSGAIGGGALLPLSSGVGELWGQVGFGWRAGTLDLAAPADPFAYVVATLGTLTWWSPSFSLVLLWFTAIPLAGLGAWMFSTRLTERPVIRAFVGLGYGLAPTLLMALSDGRPAAVLTHILLPWLCFSALKAVRSWSASATSALLFAAVVACTPSLAPVLILLWLGALVLTGRYVSRFLAVPVPALVLFAPLAIWQLLRGNPLGLLADPGATALSVAAPRWQLALGFPVTGLGGWLDLSGIGPATLNSVVSVIVVVLVGVLATLAVAGLFSPTPIRAQLALLVGLLGFASAVAASVFSVAFRGSIPVIIWPGSALSVMWLALLVAGAAGVSVLRRFSIYPAVAGITAVVILALPMGIGLIRGVGLVQPSTGETLPAYVIARADTDQKLGTLILTPQPDGGMATSLERGRGATLDNVATALTTARTVDDSAQKLATLTANLSSLSANDSRQQLRDYGIGSVLLAPAQVNPMGVTTQAATETAARAMVAFDANPALEAVGKTDVGLLWRFSHPDTKASAALTSPAGVQPWRSLVLGLQLLALVMTLLLAIPTGIPQPDIRPRRNIDGLLNEPIAFEPTDLLAGDDDEEN
jgi:GT2 family glycosyltransferase